MAQSKARSVSLFANSIDSSGDVTAEGISPEVSLGIGVDSGAVTNLIDSAYVQARQLQATPADGIDSGAVTNLIDSAYVQARQIVGGEAGLDSDEVIDLVVDVIENTDFYIDSAELYNMIDSDYVQARQLQATPADGIDSSEVINLIDSAYVQARQLQVADSGGINLSAISQSIVPDADEAYDLGSPDNKFRDIYLSGNTLVLGDTSISASDGVLEITSPSNPTPASVGFDSSDVISVITGSDLDMGTNKILYSNVYATTNDLPDASSYHGMVAHVHATGAAYFAHAGSWVQLANSSDIPTAVSSFTNDAGYTTYDSTNTLGLIDSTYVQAKQIVQDFAYSSLTNVPTNLSQFNNDTNYLDSTAVSGVIDSAYVQARQLQSTPADGVDSVAVTNLIDSAYVQARQILAAGGGGANVTISDSIGSLPNNAEAGSFYYLSTTAKLYVYTGSAWGAIDTDIAPTAPSPTNISPYFNGNFHKQYVASPYGSTITFNARAVDADGDSLAYDYLLNDPNGVIQSISNIGSNYTIITADSVSASPISATITLRVNDGNTYDTENVKINVSYAIKNVSNLDMTAISGFGTTNVNPDFKHQALNFNSFYREDGGFETAVDFGKPARLWHRDSNQYDILIGVERADTFEAGSQIADAGWVIHLKKQGADGSWAQGNNASSQTISSAQWWDTNANASLVGQLLRASDFDLIHEVNYKNRFGWSIAAHGDYVAVGAPTSRYGVNENTGLVYIYKDSDGQLIPQTILRDAYYYNGVGANNSQYGYNISLHNDRLVVRSNQVNPDTPEEYRLYFYKKGGGLDWDSNGTFWIQQDGSYAYQPVRLMDNWCVVGMHNHDQGVYTNTGAVAVFKESNGTWFHHSELDIGSTYWDAPGYTNIAAFDTNQNFGSAVDLDTSVNPPRIAVGAKGYNGGSGLVQFFEYSADSDRWYRNGHYTPGGSGQAGTNIGLSKNLCAVDAPFYTYSSVNYGRVDILEYSDQTGWVLAKRIDGNNDIYSTIAADYWPTSLPGSYAIDLIDNHMIIGWKSYNGSRGRVDIIEFNYDSGPLL